MLSEQDKSEIRKSYRNAIDPRQQVKILSRLYLVSREEILDILGPLFKSARPKPSRKGQPRRIYAPEFKAEARERLRAALREAAEEYATGEVKVLCEDGWCIEKNDARIRAALLNMMKGVREDA